jgi:hypothetical protein
VSKCVVPDIYENMSGYLKFCLESIADHTKRPLFSISSGQLVGPAPIVERTLSSLLSLAERWQAVVLIDEADVFMQERTLLELERNGLVSSKRMAIAQSP